LAGVAPGFADVLAYFRFDDLLASLMVNNWPRAPRREGERSASVQVSDEAAETSDTPY
jgi:hypothetical protein